MRESSVQPPALTSRSLPSASRRSASADPGLDVFRFPDCTSGEFALPSAWGVKQYINQNPKRFRTSAFCCLEAGASWKCDGGFVPFIVPAGFKVEDLPVKRIERPERCCPTKEGWFVDKGRLLSVLEAMISGQALPPIEVQVTASGSLEIANGFHRYFASAILGFSEIPVLWEGRQQSCGLHAQAQQENILPNNCAVFLEEQKEDGTLICVEALVIPPKNCCGSKPAVRQGGQQQQLPSKPRYEPPAVRRQRLLHEEQERRRCELVGKADTFRKKALSTEAMDQERCQQMRRPNVTYAQKTSGRMNSSRIPSWDDEPALM